MAGEADPVEKHPSLSLGYQGGYPCTCYFTGNFTILGNGSHLLRILFGIWTDDLKGPLL